MSETKCWLCRREVEKDMLCRDNVPVIKGQDYNTLTLAGFAELVEAFSESLTPEQRRRLLLDD